MNVYLRIVVGKSIVTVLIFNTSWWPQPCDIRIANHFFLILRLNYHCQLIMPYLKWNSYINKRKTCFFILQKFQSILSKPFKRYLHKYANVEMMQIDLNYSCSFLYCRSIVHTLYADIITYLQTFIDFSVR